MVHVPPVGGNSYRSSGPNDSIDNDPKFVQIVDAVWDAIKQYRANPSDVNTQTLMQEVNALNAYFSAHKPDKTNDPKAFAIWQSLTSAPPQGASLADICADYGTKDCASAVQWLENQIQGGTDPFANLYKNLDALGSAYKDQDKQDIKDCLDDLQQLLKTYNDLMKMKHPDPKLVAQLLSDISGKIVEFDQLARSEGISDGYLTLFETFINTPLSTAPGAPTFLSLCQKVQAGTPLSDSDMKALQNNAGDFQRLLTEVLYREYNE